jgi:hypothetical protein
VTDLTEYGDLMLNGVNEWGFRKIDGLLEDGTKIILVEVGIVEKSFFDAGSSVDVFTSEVLAWLAGWKKRVKLTIDHTDIDAALSNFPILLYLSTSSGRNADDVSFVFDEIGANKLKIAVTTSDGVTQCYVEIEQWDSANEKAWLWVKVPSISATADTDLYLYYDNTHADNTDYVGDDPNDAASQAVWDANFMMVHHLTGASYNVLDDSTSNNNDVAGEGATPAYNSTGKVAKAVDLERDDVDFLYVNDADTLDGFSAASWEFWFNAESIPADGSGLWRVILSKYQTAGDQRSWAIAFYGGGTGEQCQLLVLLSIDGVTYVSNYYNWKPTLGTWYHIIITWESGNAPILYINGVPTSWTSSVVVTGTLFASTQRLDIGNSYVTGRTWDGLLDEIRINNTARTAAWVKASYETQRDHLLDWGSEETEFITKSFSDVCGGSDAFINPYRAMPFIDVGHGAEAFNTPFKAMKFTDVASGTDVFTSEVLGAILKAFADAGYGIDAFNVPFKALGFSDAALGLDVFVIPFKTLKFADNAHGTDAFIVLLWKNFADAGYGTDAFTRQIFALVEKAFADAGVAAEVFTRKNVIAVTLPAIIGITMDGKLVITLKRKMEVET